MKGQLEKIASNIEITGKILKQRNWEPLTVEECTNAINIIKEYFETGFIKFSDIVTDYCQKKSRINHRTFRALRGIYGSYGANAGKEGRKQMETDEEIDDLEDELFI